MMSRACAEWRLSFYEHMNVDRELETYLNVPISGGWLKKTRRALFISTRGMALRLGVAQTTYCNFERGEVKESLSMKQLRRCAEAMDCEFVYAIRPKRKVLFSTQIWRILAEAIRENPLLRRSPSVGLILYCARRKMYDPQFRRDQKWAANSQEQAREFAQLLKANRGVRYHANAVQLPIK